MSEERTPEQKTADKILGEAIRKCAIAYGMNEKTTIVNYAVVLQGLEFDEKTKPISCDFLIIEDNGERTPEYQLIGMLRSASLRAERNYLFAHDEDEEIE